MLEDAHLVLAGRGGPSRVVVEEGLRFGNLQVIEGAEVAQGRFPAPVGRLVLAHQHERLVGIALLLEPLEAQVGYDVRSVPDVLNLLAVLLHARVVIRALAIEDFIAVESGRIGLQVPLANQGCAVACLS